MSAKIAVVNQTRSETESMDRGVTVSVINVQAQSVPPPPSYEQAIFSQSKIERQRIQRQQRALEELVQEQNRLERVRRGDEEQPIERQPQEQSAEQITATTAPSATSTTTAPTTSTTMTNGTPQIIQHVYMASPLVGPNPTNLTCPSCHAAIKTRIEYVTSTKTHLGAIVCCVLCWPCAFCPYFLESCRDALHYCPSCGAYIGAHTAFRA